MVDVTHAILSLQPNAAFICKSNDYNKITWLDNTVQKPTYEEVLAEITRLEKLEPMKILRAERNELLTASDWRATIDYQGTKQSEWLTYRQALRDLPANTADANNPTWPTAPEGD
tara:strand:+ start:220 stop:564 length:345 start_codon:yes stop_codon:yes gene_type:complete